MGFTTSSLSPNPKRAIMSYDIVPTFLSAFDADQRANVRAALKWAEEAESIDWEKVLPDLPHSDPFKRAHLRTVLKRIDATYGGVVPGAG